MAAHGYLIPSSCFALRQGRRCPVLSMGKLQGRWPGRCCPNCPAGGYPGSLHLAIPSSRLLGSGSGQSASLLLFIFSLPYLSPGLVASLQSSLCTHRGPCGPPVGMEVSGRILSSVERETRSSPPEPKAVTTGVGVGWGWGNVPEGRPLGQLHLESFPLSFEDLGFLPNFCRNEPEGPPPSGLHRKDGLASPTAPRGHLA